MHFKKLVLFTVPDVDNFHDDNHVQLVHFLLPPRPTLAICGTSALFGAVLSVDAVPLFGTDPSIEAVPLFGTDAPIGAIPLFGTDPSIGAVPLFEADPSIGAVPLLGEELVPLFVAVALRGDEELLIAQSDGKPPIPSEFIKKLLYKCLKGIKNRTRAVIRGRNWEILKLNKFKHMSKLN